MPAFDGTNNAEKPSGITFMSRAVRADPGILSRLRDAQLVQIMRDSAAEIARLEALLLRAIATLNIRRRHAPGFSSEVALTLSVTEKRAADMIAAAGSLTGRLSRTLGLMDQGVLDLYRALKVSEATASLTDEQAGIVDLWLESRLPGKNATQVRKAATYAVAKADSAGSAERAIRKRAERQLRLYHGSAGVAHLSVSNADTEKATAAYMRIDQVARGLKAQGEVRTLDQLRADVTMDLLLTAEAAGMPARAEVFLYVDLATYLGMNSDPALLAGHGPVPASVAQRIISGPDTTLRRIITDPLTGQALELGKTSFRLTADAEEFIRVRDRECRQPGCTRAAQSCSVEPTPATPGKDGKPGITDELVTYCPRHRKLKNRPEWGYQVQPEGTLVVTTPTGDAHRSATPPLHSPRRRGKSSKRSSRQ